MPLIYIFIRKRRKKSKYVGPLVGCTDGHGAVPIQMDKKQTYFVFVWVGLLELPLLHRGVKFYMQLFYLWGRFTCN